MRVNIIGGGPAGYTAALRLAENGVDVILFEKGDIGGTCLNVGCIPTKSLLHMANLYNNASLASYINKENISFDVELANLKKDSQVKKLKDNLTKYLNFNKIKIVNGSAKIISQNIVDCDGTLYESDKIIIATGSKLAKYNIYGLDFAYTTDILTRQFKIAKTITIIGGGAVGLEFAWLYNLIGSEVTVIMMESMPLANCDIDLSRAVSTNFKKYKIKMNTNSIVKSISKLEEKYIVKYENLEKEEFELTSDFVLDATGRVANLDTESLDYVGILYDKKGIYVNENFETNIKNIFAIGDVVNGNTMLAHKASFDAENVASYILGIGNPYSLKYVPFCIYISPEIASIGITTAKCEESGLKYLSAKSILAANGRAVATESDNGFIKVIFIESKEGGNEYYLGGVHIVSENASEMLGYVSTLLNLKATVHDILSTPFLHPSISEGFRDAVLQIKKSVNKLKV